MNRFIRIILAVILLFGLSPYQFIYSSDDLVPKTVEEVLAKINLDMEKLYGEKDYYKDHINKDSKRLNLRKDLIRDRLNRALKPIKGLEEKDKIKLHTYEIVYGESHGRKLNHKGKEMMEYSGYSRDGHAISTEDVPWFAGWSGTKIQNFPLISEPWTDESVKDKYRITGNRYDAYKDPFNQFLPDGTFEAAIIAGLNTNFAGVPYKEFMYNNQNSTLADKVVYDENAKPLDPKTKTNTGRWIDYVHVLQPPTEISWGFGTVYIDSSIGITYLDIPIAPFNMLQDDISAQFEELPVEVVRGEPVRVGVKVNSTFIEEVNSKYEWIITRVSDGRRMTSAEGLKFSGHGTAESGTVKLNRNQSRILYADFQMPDSEVRIQFNINKDGKSPEEADLSNNILDSNPRAVKLVVPVGLDYDVLSKREKFPLNQGITNTATVTLPRPDAWWTSNTTGALKVTNNTPTLFRAHQVLNNPPVNEPSETVTRSPIFLTTIKREDFGDDPLNRKWMKPAPSPSTPIQRIGTVSQEGSVQKNYSYNVTTCSEGEDGKDVCTTKTESDTATASFQNGLDTKAYEVYVYNGKETITKPTFLNKIDNNTRDSFKKDLYWENESYKYNVIRWMYHLNEEGKPYKPEGVKTDAADHGVAVPGQYPRSFTQQASANVEWMKDQGASSNGTVFMNRQYEMARSAAKDRNNNKKMYDKAVFASDRELQKYAYPIKSGYYFNPAGSYTFTVKTVTFKQSENDTADHRDLVNAVINAFRYETNLIYINSDKKAVNLQNVELYPQRGGFKIVPGVLKAENPRGVNNAVLLEVKDRKSEPSRYNKEVEPIYFSQDQDESKTHAFWKKVLEGYSESSTAGSHMYYKYREFVKNTEPKMYKITETTEVTIQINPENIPVYTHASMQNGKYYVKAWVEDIKLSTHEYRKLNTLNGIQVLDQIEVTVAGSMFDDLNN
ncbi:hypothetical protein [Paenibacillus bouchesdurhonensis]|uniref:hypothetical protein n=1 Tax=Paenibacillus bouchesdurhonensis TaxID=1870990 RepID=UPI000DA61C01|nr:hypothetical protein [Paenibacillus bouchesdurhonensis]